MLFLEWSAQYQYQSHLAKFIEDFAHHANITNTGNGISWKMCGKQGVGLLSFISYAFGCPLLDAIATLENLLDLKFSNLARFTSLPSDSLQEIGVSPENNSIPQILFGLEETFRNEIFHRIACQPIKDSASRQVAAVVWYKTGKQNFCIQASVSQHKLSIGAKKPEALFLHQDLIERYPLSQIVLMQDMRTALVINKKLNELPGYSPSEFIVTSHLCRDLKLLPWKVMCGHEVIFAPAPLPVFMEMAKEYERFIRGAHAAGFRVIQKQFLRGFPDFVLEEVKNNLSQFEAELLSNASWLEHPYPHGIMGEIRSGIASSLELADYTARNENLGIFQARCKRQYELLLNKSVTLPAFDDACAPLNPDLNKIYLEHTFRPGTYGIIIGAKDSGKARIAFASCASLLCKDRTGPLFRSNSPMLPKVCYVDGETPREEAVQIMRHYGLDKFENSHFFFWSIFSGDEYGQTFSLNSQEFRDKLECFLMENCIGYLVLDNLLSLTDNQPNSHADAILSWIQKLQAKGLAILLLHHKYNDPREDKARSNENYINKARYVCNLVNQDVILQNQTAVSEAVKEKAKSDGLIVGIKFQAHKVAPVLKSKIFWYFQSLNSSEFECLGAIDQEGNLVPWCNFAQQTDPAPKPSSTLKILAGSASLSPDCHKALEAIEKLGRPFTRKELDEELEWSPDKTGSVLKELCGYGLLNKFGEGKATYYALNAAPK